MHWDTWILLAITMLCALVIAWSWLGFHRERLATRTPTLRLPLNGGGHLDLPATTHRHRPHHPRHRA